MSVMSNAIKIFIQGPQRNRFWKSLQFTVKYKQNFRPNKYFLKSVLGLKNPKTWYLILDHSKGFSGSVVHGNSCLTNKDLVPCPFQQFQWIKWTIVVKGDFNEEVWFFIIFFFSNNKYEWPFGVIDSQNIYFISLKSPSLYYHHPASRLQVKKRSIT